MDDFIRIEIAAENYGWQNIPARDPRMFSFIKEIDGSPSRINIWFSKRGITVATCINHPKQGKTQLFRKQCSVKLVEKIFQNPRIHTGKGYK